MMAKQKQMAKQPLSCQQGIEVVVAGNKGNITNKSADDVAKMVNVLTANAYTAKEVEATIDAMERSGKVLVSRGVGQRGFYVSITER